MALRRAFGSNTSNWIFGLADVFLSYASEDRGRIEILAHALEAAGYSVWWDRHIRGGTEFSDEIERALGDAKVVVVAWSTQSLRSHWVKDEAAFARDRNLLVPVQIDAVDPPLGFRQHQTIDFGNWTGDIRAAAFKDLLEAIHAKTQLPPTPVPAEPSQRVVQHNILPELNAHSVSLVLGGLGIVVAIVAMFVVFLAPSKNETASALRADAAASDGTSIAVLPFVSMSAAQDDEFFADGLSEELLNVLTNIDRLKVAARTSSFHFKGKNEDLKTIGASLDVEHILEGSVRRSGDQLRITAQLIKVEDGYHLWSETYDRTTNDVFAIQDDISQQVAKALKSTLLGISETESSSIPSGALSDPDLQRKFLVAQAKLSQRGLENLNSARKLYEEVVAGSPDFARAHVGVANSILLLAINHSEIPMGEAIDAAKAAAGIAVSLAPNESEVYATLGQIASEEAKLNRNPEQLNEALQNFEQSLQLNPQNVQATYWYGIALESNGELERALAAYEHALSLDPLARVAHYRKGLLLSLMGRFADAEKQLLETLSLFPDYLATEIALSDLDLLRGRLDRAVYWADRAHKANPQSFTYRIQLSVRLAELGDVDGATALLDADPNDDSYAGAIERAITHVIQSEHDELFDVVKIIAATGDPNWKTAAPNVAMIVGDMPTAQALFNEALPDLYDVDFEYTFGGIMPDAAIGPAYVEMQIGDKTLAKNMLRSALAYMDSNEMSHAYTGYRRHGIRALLLIVLNNKGEALEELNAAYDAGYRGGWIMNIARPGEYPPLEALNESPEYKALILKMERDIESMREKWKSGITTKEVEAELESRGIVF